jgi:hypothetical protein
LIEQIRTIHSLLKHDRDFVEINEKQRASLNHLVHTFDHMVHTTHNGIESFNNQDGHFASVYTKLVTGSTEITENGVSYRELRDLIIKSFVDAELMA